MNSNINYIWLYGIADTSGGATWMVGEGGKIFKSLNNGEEWEEVKY
jgi:hypothetical protein